MAPCMPLNVMENNVIALDGDSVVDVKALAVKLSRMGYERVPQVEAGGQFSIRGGIIDVFDLTEDNPYRIELWGDEVDSIRRTLRTRGKCTIKIDVPDEDKYDFHNDY